jgi:UDP-N-acetylglucosamine transferase subunit ALG13
VTAPATARVLVTAGTDHHRFDRLMDWIERWIAARGEPVDVLVQTGTSRAPAGARSVAMMTPEEFEDALRSADVVVTQGGPGGIVQARRAGRRPIVVPRRHGLGEHVDDHQVAFCRRMATEGDVVLAETEDGFRVALDAAIADPDSLAATADEAHVAQTVRTLGTLIERLLPRNPSP